MSTQTNIIDRLYVRAECTGVGQRQARGSGDVGLRMTDTGRVEISVGRSGKWSAKVATAWAHLTKEKAHELAVALLYVVGQKHSCEGDGVKITGHSPNLNVTVNFTTDLCTLLHKGEQVKVEVMQALDKELNKIKLPSVEGQNHA